MASSSILVKVGSEEKLANMKIHTLATIYDYRISIRFVLDSGTKEKEKKNVPEAKSYKASKASRGTTRNLSAFSFLARFTLLHKSMEKPLEL